MAKTLVVDDDPEVEAMFSGVGDGAGDSEFVFARSDEEAIDILTSRDDLDMAIVAIDSEVVSGMDMFHRLDAKDARLPRIALSATPDINLLRQSLKDGASDFLVKPVSSDELTETLNEGLPSVRTPAPKLEKRNRTVRYPPRNRDRQ